MSKSKSPVKPARKPKQTEQAPIAAPEPQVKTLIWKAIEGTETVGVSVMSRWISECGQYRITRIAGGDVRYGSEWRVGDRWDSVERDPELGGGYPRWYEKMADAVSVCVKHGSFETSNANEVMAALMNPIADKAHPSATTEGRAPRTPRQPKAPGDAQPSNKGQVFQAWKASPDETPESLHKLVDGRVQLGTIRSWIGQWKRGNNLPVGASA